MIRGPFRGGNLPEQYCSGNYEKVKKFHQSLDVYAPTPLVSLTDLAERIGVKAIYVKDESKRYGLNAFKALGAAYAVDGVLKGSEGKPLFVTATDGNHGRAVAWAADRAGCRSKVFMPKGTAKARLDNINNIPLASAEITDLNYDDAVRLATKYAEENGGVLVQDTGFEGYEDIPWDISLGYTMMGQEALEQLAGVKPTHVFLQAGVGSMAGGVLGFLKDIYGADAPVFSIMEAEQTACIYESVRQGKYVAIGGDPQTIMAGLNCGEANTLTLPVLEAHAEFFFSMSDEYTEEGMRELAAAGVVAGECGGIGTGLVKALMTQEELAEYRDALGLDENSIILLFSTEGDTDPVNYKKIIEG